jgi:hypothetical protein
MNETVKTMNPAAMRKLRPDFAIYHPNGKGTGCAFRMNLLPAGDGHDGCIMMNLANQSSVGNRQGAVPKYPTFDWKNSVVVKFGFPDICKMIQVLRGTSEELEGGKGLYHRSAKYATKITLKHITEPVTGFMLGVYRSPAMKTVAEEEQSARILLSTWEALGIALAFEHSIGAVCFGVPKPMEGGMEGPRDVPAA